MVEKGEKNVMIVEKYQGCGNDFLIASLPSGSLSVSQVRRLCDRHYGLGADGVILLQRQPLTMTVINADGSAPSMCGNGLRCAVHYAWRHGWIRQSSVSVHTADGVREARIVSTEPFVCELDMGCPDFDSRRITARFHPGLVHPPCCPQSCSCSFWIGVPHTVIFVDDPASIDDDRARQIEQDPFFCQGTNVDFVCLDPERAVLRIRTWERGVGWTLSCGSGACAAAAAGSLFGLCRLPVTVRSAGGELQVRTWRQRLFLCGKSGYIGKVEWEEDQNDDGRAD